jgi:hypothetical protein
MTSGVPDGAPPQPVDQHPSVSQRSIEPPEQLPELTWRDYVLRPGSLGRSTDLWFAFPPLTWWIALIATLSVGRAVDVARFGSTVILAALSIGSIALVIWSALVLLSQRESDSLQPGGRRVDHALRHEYWRARTIAWGLFSVGTTASGLLLFIWAGLSTSVPAADLPFLELAVLVMTLVLLAIFARYNSMTFRTDGDRLVQHLEETSRIETAARLAETERLVGTFTGQTDRLVAKIEAQSLTMSGGLAGIALRLQNVADAIQTQSRIAAEARAAAQQAAELQRQAIEDAATREAARISAELRAAQDRVERIRPDIRVQMRGQGILFHHLYVDIFNRAMDGVGLRVRVLTARGTGGEFVEPGIRSNSPRSFDLGDVNQFLDAERFTVTVLLADVDGNPYEYAAQVDYERETGLLGRTTGIRFNPTGWVRPSVRALRPPPAS